MLHWEGLSLQCEVPVISKFKTSNTDVKICVLKKKKISVKRLRW